MVKDVKNNQLTFEEFEKLLFGVYDDLKFILKMGDPVQKRRAYTEFLRLQLAMKESVEQYEKETGVDFKRIDKMVEGQKGWFFEECENFKKKSQEYQKELEPLIEKTKEDVEIPVSKAKRKSKMKKALKSRE